VLEHFRAGIGRRAAPHHRTAPHDVARVGQLQRPVDELLDEDDRDAVGDRALEPFEDLVDDHRSEAQ